MIISTHGGQEQFVFLRNNKIRSNWHTPQSFFAIGQASDAVLLKIGQNHAFLLENANFLEIKPLLLLS